MEHISAFPARFRFLVKLICCAAFGWLSSTCCFITITDSFRLNKDNQSPVL